MKFKDAIAKRANERLRGGQGGVLLAQKSAQANQREADTRKKIAEIAGVSHDTVGKVEFLQTHADDATKEDLRSGKTTINKEYNRVKKDVKLDVVPVETDPETGLVLSTKTIRRVDLRNLRRDDPETLIMPLMGTFTLEYRRKLIFDLLEIMCRDDGPAVVGTIVEKLVSLYLK